MTVATRKPALALVLAHEARKYAGIRRFTPANNRGHLCDQPECNNAAYANRLCNAHYIRKRLGKDMSEPLRQRRSNLVCLKCENLVDSKGGWGLCKSHFRKARSVAIKTFLVEALGGCCSVCLQSFPLSVYDFHHVNNKDDDISELIANASIERIEAEVSKCVLLCANCHRIEHHDRS